MSESSRGSSRKPKEGMFNAITIGFLLVLVGMLFVVNPDLPNKIIDFARPESFELKTVGTSLNVSLPIPKDLRAHLLLYRTAEQFCLVWAVFLVAMQGVRFILVLDALNQLEDRDHGRQLGWLPSHPFRGPLRLVVSTLPGETKSRS